MSSAHHVISAKSKGGYVVRSCVVDVVRSCIVDVVRSCIVVFLHLL